MTSADPQAAVTIMEDALQAADYLTESQRRNARLKAQDLQGKKREWDSVPFRLLIECNRRCNTKCLHCDIEHLAAGELSAHALEGMMEEVGWGSMEIMPCVAGESTLAPMDLLEPLARKYNNFFNFTTNGYLFTRDYYERISDLVARVHFSLNTPRREVGNRIMPGLDFDTRIRNIRDAATIAKTTGAQILTGIVVMECNIEDLERYVRFVADLGVERIIFQKLYPGSSVFQEQSVTVHRSPAEVEDHVTRAFDAAMGLGIFVETNLDEIFAHPRNLNPHSSRFDFLQESSDVVGLFRPGFCISVATTVLVEWDGTVLPCCRDHIELGNINEESFSDIWNGARMKQLRATLFGGELRGFCRQCMAFFNEHA